MECNERVLSFIAEWFDPHPQIKKQYLLKYHSSTNEVEMKDIQTKRQFLKKTKLPPTLKESDFFVGANVLLLSRDLKLIDFGDNQTRDLLESVDERTVCVVPPSLYETVGDVVALIEQSGFTLVDLKTMCYNEEALKLLNMEDPKELTRAEPMVAIAVRGSNSVAAVNQLIQSSSFANIRCPRNAEEAKLYTNLMRQQSSTTATFEDCTCCVIKPHAVKERSVGEILKDIISRGFVLSAVSMFTLERAAAAEFLEVYEGVVPEYSEMVDEFCSGSCVAMEIRLKPQLLASAAVGNTSNQQNEVVEKFRACCGPWDVNMAKELQPNTLRAIHGRDRVRNSLHCTDLPKDGLVEVEYFFKILSKTNYIDGWK